MKKIIFTESTAPITLQPLHSRQHAIHFRANSPNPETGALVIDNIEAETQRKT
jgi:hypothetical protein